MYSNFVGKGSEGNVGFGLWSEDSATLEATRNGLDETVLVAANVVDLRNLHKEGVIEAEAGVLAELVRGVGRKPRRDGEI